MAETKRSQTKPPGKKVQAGKAIPQFLHGAPWTMPSDHESLGLDVFTRLRTPPNHGLVRPPVVERTAPVADIDLISWALPAGVDAGRTVVCATITSCRTDDAATSHQCFRPVGRRPVTARINNAATRRET